MRVVKTINSKLNLCDYCQLDYAACPKANHIKFGYGKGNDNVIECSEMLPKNQYEANIRLASEYGVIKKASSNLKEGEL